MLGNKRSHGKKKPAHCSQRVAPACQNERKPMHSNENAAWEPTQTYPELKQGMGLWISLCWFSKSFSMFQMSLFWLIFWGAGGRVGLWPVFSRLLKLTFFPLFLHSFLLPLVSLRERCKKESFFTVFYQNTYTIILKAAQCCIEWLYFIRYLGCFKFSWW